MILPRYSGLRPGISFFTYHDRLTEDGLLAVFTIGKSVKNDQ